MSESKLNCFVIIGFGMKTDLATGRTLDLDKTFTELIKPAFDRAGLNCFRAIDVNIVGSIDDLMYQWIYDADMVVADISTLNANVFYELGVRHALKPKTTIIISEKELMGRLPFDINHTIIHEYEHLGEDISEEEKKRFVDHLGSIADSLKGGAKRDSPVYTYLRGMTPPEYIDIEEKEKRVTVPTAEDNENSISALVNAAEKAKNSKDFVRAIALLEAAHELDPHDIFIVQRLCLSTYYSKLPDTVTALQKAEQILQQAEPDRTTDPETLGLAGAIYKRYFQQLGDMKYLDKSMYYYGRGFYVKQDYYTGINLAFSYTIKANLVENDFDAITCYGQGNEIRKMVADICEKLIDSTSFGGRGDKEWVYQTLAQAYLGLGRNADAEALIPKINALSNGAFDLDTFNNQNEELIEAIAAFKKRINIENPTVVDIGAASTKGSTTETITKTIVPQVLKAPGKPIVITIDETANKPIKAVEVNCKIEFE